MTIPLMIIKNKKQLSKTKTRAMVLEVLEFGYQAINLQNVLKDKLRISGNNLIINSQKIDLRKFKRIFVCGIGKCALETGKYLEKTLGKKIAGGIVLDTRTEKLKYIKSIKGDHPQPSLRNLRISQKILRLIESLNPKEDFLIFIVSGGGSSLFFSPCGIKPKDMISLSLDLHKSGTNIHEFNIVRKHLSSVQGGKLGLSLRPLKILALYFSDVVSETNNKNLETIASGPFYTDKHNDLEARKVLQKYGLWRKYSKKILGFSETVKNKKHLSHISQQLLLTNTVALEALVKRARQIGFKPKILSSTFSAEANTVFNKVRILADHYPKHDFFIIGGEMTIKVGGKGRGGRNQQAVLASLKNIKDNESFVCVASDGIDNTEYAGAISDYLVFEKARKLNLNTRVYLKNNDSFSFFKKTGDYIKTGKTGVNVADIILYYRKKRDGYH